MQKSILKSTAANFLVNSKDHLNKQHHQGDSDGRKKQCVYCKGAHSAYNCDRVTDYQKRLDIIKRSNLCFNCLANHRVPQCSSKFRCRKCKKKHHTRLCNNSASHTKSETSRSDDKAVGSATPTTTAGLLTPASCCKTPKSTACLLKTAVAPIIANGIKSQANILFNEGAQRSFLSAEMASELQISPTTQTNIAMASFGSTSMTHQKLGSCHYRSRDTVW